MSWLFILDLSARANFRRQVVGVLGFVACFGMPADLSCHECASNADCKDASKPNCHAWTCEAR